MTTNIVPELSNMTNTGSFKNLVHLARHRAAAAHDFIGYIYLQDGEKPTDQLNYEELDERAQAIAAKLQARCSVGDRVLLLYPSGLDFMCAFFGCLYAGCVAIPAYPPRRNRHDARLEGIVLDAEPTLVLTTDDILNTCGHAGKDTDALYLIPWLSTSNITAETGEQWDGYNPEPDSIAFIQYTSGSTSQPKGVCVSHFNLLHNMEDMHLGCAHDENSVMVTWLPIHHDLGLIYGALQPLYRGFPCYMMPPASFLQRPLRWLEAISRFKGSHSAAPNFAFDLCVRGIGEEEAASLDLSSMRAVLNAAEPIRAESLQRFFDHFGPAGFSPKALKGGYGLAEATLKVSMVHVEGNTPITYFDSDALERNRVVPVKKNSNNGTRSIVGCGRTESDTEYIIVDPQTRLKCATDEVGEIWVKGPTLAAGYHNRSKENEEIFNAQLADSGVGPYLRTGDLGFIYRDHLYITGRIKDMIIIRGMNHYPHDIELTAEKACPELRNGCGAAFSIDSGGQERLVVIYELDRKYLRSANTDAIMARMKEAVADEHGISVYSVVLLRTNTIPKTTSGKIQRQASRLLYLENTLTVVAATDAAEEAGTSTERQKTSNTLPDSETLRAKLLEIAAFHLHMDAQEINPDEPLAHYGLDSAAAIALTGEVERYTQCPCNPTVLYECPTIQLLQDHLQGVTRNSVSEDLSRPAVRLSGSDESAIAVVGLGGRFPGAETLDEFWSLLIEGRSATGEVPAERWDINEYFGDESEPDTLNIRWGGFLENIDLFDAEFFNISPREADCIDPQHRLLLEVAWEALENGGIRPSSLHGSDSGVFMGISAHDYLQLQTDSINTVTAYTGIGGAHCLAANRLSYFLDLHGPSMAVDTACSSSLVAVHHAVTSLRRGECSLAFAGGVNAILTPHLTVGLAKAQMLSPDGSCKVFDAEANGYVRGEGCGVVILKRLHDAVAAGNRIHAVIRGTSVKQDGKSNGITAPNRLAQESVIRAALRDANLTPGSVSYVEAHGTGTALGDPIEVEAIRNVYADNTATNTCHLGSVKANIGHLESGAGIAGLIKAILAINNEVIPGNIKLRTPNPLIQLDDTRMRISPESVSWNRGEELRTAGVSSFGFGGTIAHAIVTEFNGAAVSHYETHNDNICTISARSVPALKASADRLARYLESQPGLALDDICYTQNMGREHFDCKRAIVASSVDELRLQLNALMADSSEDAVTATSTPGRILFLFSGQGVRQKGVARELLRTEPLFRAAIEECDVIVKKQLDISVVDEIEADDDADSMVPTRVQPMVFALQYGLAQLWRSRGIVPDSVIGHSLGEYAAACIAGVMKLEIALGLVIQRSRLAEKLPVWGGMVAVFGDHETVKQTVEGSGCDVAVINGPQHIIISGSERAIAGVLPQFKQAGLRTVQLEVTHGFHSACVDPMLDEFMEYAAQVSYNKAKIVMYSTVTGRAAGDEIARPDYWRDHLRQPVQFQKAMTSAVADPNVVVIEIGPSPTLISMARRFCKDQRTVWIPTLRPGVNDVKSMLEGLAELYTLGHLIDWEGFYQGNRYRRISLPTYPFQRKRHWISAVTGKRGRKGVVEHPLLGNRLAIAQPDGRIIWQNTLAVSDIPYLRDHVVNGMVVFPGTAFTEMLAAAARSAGFADCIDISNLEFSLPLVFNNDSEQQCLQTIIDRKGDSLICAIYSRGEEATPDNDWCLHAKGIVSEAAYSGRTIEIADIEERCTEVTSGVDFYHHWNSRGNEWGPSFQGIEYIKAGNFEAAAWLKTTTEVKSNGAMYVVHPALFDSCVQVMSAGAGGTGPFVGRRVGRLHITGSLVGDLIVLVTWTQRNQRLLVGDLTVLDNIGNIVLIAEDLTFTFLDKGSYQTWKTWIYTEKWEKIHLPAPPVDAVSLKLIVTGARDEFTEGYTEHFEASGHRVHHVDTLDKRVLSDGDHYAAKILCFLPCEKTLSSPDDMGETILSLVMQAADIVSRISENSGTGTAKIWFVTRNVWPGSTDAVPQAAAGLWGLGSAMAAEYSAHWGGLIDIEEGTDANEGASQILHAITVLRNCDKLHIGRDISTPKLQPVTIPARGLTDTIRSDGAYLITGGLGNLGRAVSQWLAERGARHIILIGRSGLPVSLDMAEAAGETRDEKILLLQELEAAGVHVTVAALDISDAKALRSWADQYTKEGNPQVIGIFHAAGVVGKEPIGDISEETGSPIIRAKAAGILAIEQVFDLRSMDMVVLFSSAATIFNSPFLGSYAAANAFLDSYAHLRILEGYPVTSVNWGTFAGGGMAALAEQAGDATFSKLLRPLSTDEGTEILGQLLDSSAARVAVLPVDWKGWRGAYPSQAELMYWEKVLSGISQQTGDNDSLPDLEALSAIPDSDRHAVIAKGLARLVSRTLGAVSDGVSTSTPLTALGIDSLMALEIRSVIEKAYGITLAVVTIIGGASIEVLAQTLDGLLDSERSEAVAGNENESSLEEACETGCFPLSFNQYSQWLLSSISPDVSAYHVSFSARLTGDLDENILKRCLEILVERHASLRTTYTIHEGEVSQKIHSTGKPLLIKTDAAGWTDDELYTGAQKAYAEPFNLLAGPLLRAHLFTRDPGDHILLLVVHHIASDGWSLWLMLEELEKIYDAESGTAGAILPEIGASYLAYSRRQRAKWSDEERLATSRQFWSNRLADFPLVLDLETDYQRPEIQSLNGSSSPLHISSEVTASLKKMAGECNTTMYTLLMAAYHVLLHRITNRPKLLVGSPTAGRAEADTARTVGHFVNMIVIRGDLSTNPTWLEFVESMRQEILECLEYQDFPFHLLVEHLQPERLPGRSPVFQVDFTFQRSHTNSALIDFMGGTGGDTRLNWGDVELSPFVIPQQEGQFDLSLEMAEGAESLFGFMKYNSDIFHPETIEHLCRSFCAIVASVCEAPEQRIREISLLDTCQRSIVTTWAQEQVKPVAELCIHELFAAQVRDIPDERAVVCGTSSLSYRELDERSDAIAWRLKAFGVESEAIIGVCLERSTEMIASILAVLKAGCAYLPLESSHPTERRRIMLVDSGAEVLISDMTDHELQGLEINVCNPFSIEPSPKPFKVERTVTPSNLAYLIYTSGSTGTPKGVMVEHRSVMNLLAGLDELIYSKYEERQQVSLFASTVFDASVQQIFAALCGGHTLHVLSEDCRRDGDRLLNYWRKAGVTIADGTPTLLNMMLDAGLAEADGMSLKHLIIGGEPLSGETVRRLKSGRTGHDVRLTNIYGPTECCVDVTAMDLSFNPPPDSPVMPIGRPMVNTEVYILDDNKEPVVPGAAGELYIGGPSVARGYLNQYELTADCFVSNPFNPEARLYRTGDLVRYLPKGVIAFLGRNDSQLKLRGFRIEPGEIEHRLCSFPHVKDAVAIIREDTPGDRRLVAYLVADEDNEELSQESLRDKLAGSLPGYMIPSIFVVLQSLPLNASGKVDRGRLPAPAEEKVLLRTGSVKPKTEFEREVAAIWQKVIGLNEVGIHDNFFDLGGNSLLLTKVQIQLQDSLAQEITITDLFRFPTIHLLAQFYTENTQRVQGTSPEEEVSGRQKRRGLAATRGRARRMLREDLTETEI